MTDKERDELELFEARKAHAAAQSASTRTDAAAATLHRASDGIRTIVDRNGYVERFRQLLRGA